MNIAIIGYGSIGKRHEKNCLELGYEVDILSRHEVRKLTKESYDLAIICSKTSEHLEDVRRFKNLSKNFLIEKPIGATYKEAQQIKKILSGKKVRVGYCLIFSPIIQNVKKLLEKKEIGDIFFADIYSGSYLPNWREGGDYRKRYSAKKEEGGGVTLDLIHEINYAQYFFGEKIINIYSYQNKISNLEITSNDFAHFIIRQDKRLLTITLNYFQLSPERYIKMIGSNGTLFADLIAKTIVVFNENNKKILEKKFDFDSNQMYIDEIKSMVRFNRGNEKNFDILSIDQGIKDLRIANENV